MLFYFIKTQIIKESVRLLQTVHFNCLYLSAWLSCWRLWEESHIFTFGPLLRGRRDLTFLSSKASAV